MSDTSKAAASEFIADLRWRGLIAQSTNEQELVDDLAAGPITLYCGFDPTAISLHVGNLVPLLALRRFQQQGHQPIALVGGATGLIGDPSGRASERTLNTPEVIEGWVDRIKDQVSSFIDFSGDNSGLVVSNLEWTHELSAIEFLRDVGKHFSVNVMLSKDSVKTRLADQGISFTEFSYMLLQSYDYLELFRQHGCRLQIGGSDQWGNITAGLDLIRRVEGSDAVRAHALTVPLVTKADGTKFGKTAGGAIWLDAELTSPYEFYQYWLNADDRDIEAFTKIFSMQSRALLEERLRAHAKAPHKRIAQRELAAELTKLVHGDEELEQALAAGQALFGGGDLNALSETTLEAVLATAPGSSYEIADDAIWPSVVDALVASGLAKGKGDARRVIKEGGAYLNNERVTDDSQLASAEELLHGRWWLLRRGKKSFASLEVTRGTI